LNAVVAVLHWHSLQWRVGGWHVGLADVSNWQLTKQEINARRMYMVI
jgi:hypothetical protein